VDMCSHDSTCTSSLYTLTYDQITVEFHCSRLIATLGLALFVAGLGTGPMVSYQNNIDPKSLKRADVNVQRSLAHCQRYAETSRSLF
jgi:hypothetical protein